jgi:hypothetical protein
MLKTPSWSSTIDSAAAATGKPPAVAKPGMCIGRGRGGKLVLLMPVNIVALDGAAPCGQYGSIGSIVAGAAAACLGGLRSDAIECPDNELCRAAAV